MAPISLKKSIIDDLAGELVIDMLNIGKDEPNFKIASEYVMSNLRFHRFLDVNPLEVSRSLKGICSKFRVNIQDKKAVGLENLVEEFVNQSLIERKDDEKDVQTDVHYSLLTLMLNLSNNPLKSEFVYKDDDAVKKTEDVAFDWNTYLLSGEERLGIGVNIDEEDEKQLYDSDDEFWDLTDDEEIAKICDQTEVDSDLEKDKKIVDMVKENEVIKSFDVTWIYTNVVPSYWKDNEALSFKINNETTYSAGYSNICKNWEIYKRETEGQSRVCYKLLTERQLVMETLWMLQGIEHLYVYKFEDGKYIPNENIAVTHLTEETLKAYLTTFTSMGDKVVSLKKYSEQVLNGVDGSVSKSFRAFGYVLGRYLMGRCAFLADMEKTWINKDQTITLSVLRGCLEDDKKHIECIYQVYVEAVCTGLLLYSTETERLVYFMDVFYKRLCMFDSLGEAGQGEFVTLLPMFLDICQPYLNDMDNWMTMGQLPRAGDEEFMIYMAKDIEKGEADYWLKTYQIKETKDAGNNISTLVPIFVQGMQKQILLAGKSLGLLAEFGNYATNICSTNLYDEFKDNLKTRLQEVNEQPLKDVENGKDDIDSHPSAYIDDPEIDPLLKENFKVMFLDVYKKVRHEKLKAGNVCQPRQLNGWDVDLLKDASFRPPIRLLVEQCLFPVISQRYKEACAFLLEFFKTEFKLFDHLKVMGNFFLMQAGGTIHAFLSELFDMAKRNVYWQDVAYLNIVLQDALQLNFPNMIETLKVELQSLEKRSSAQLFDGLSLRYNAPWPITIILDVKTEQQYNEIFKFLLKVKRAIWVLEQLRFYELIVPPERCLEQDQDGSNTSDEEDLQSPRRKMVRDDIILDPPKQRLKLRLVILRMKMLHALHNFHFYLMTRITHAINVELDPKVKESKDLGEILEVHYMFLRNLKKRCFLHENIGRSKEAIFRILSLVFDFELLWLSNIDNIDPKRLDIIDNDFHRCKDFLHSFFSTLGKRGSYPHFEFLAHSLKS